MSLRSDPLAALVVPDGTTVEEHAIVTGRDVVVGAQSEIALGVRGRNVIAGERVAIDGDLEVDADCRLDTWCEIGGNVLAGADAYIGERVTIDGQLVVAGDLDIGDDVTIEEGFDANGWIVIRNPVPTLVFLFTYLTHLLHIGEEDLAEDVVSEIFDDPDDQPLVIPKNADVTDDAWRVSTPAEVGNDCRLHGNLRAETITVGERTEIFGSLRARESIAVAGGTTIHGDVTTRGGEVEIAADARIKGDIACERLRLHEGAVVEGAMRARGEMTIVRERESLATDEPSTGRTDSIEPTESDGSRPNGPDSDDSNAGSAPGEDREPSTARSAETDPAADDEDRKESSVVSVIERVEGTSPESPEPAIREAEPETAEREESAGDPGESAEPKGSFTPPE